MRFFNYGRKSVYSDKSDSIDNQFRMSREYCEQKFPGKIESWQEFSDEDFTGANTSRPDLQRMLSYIEEGFCDVLVVYQLDRLSRNVRDFSNIYAMLEEHNVMFISIKENIDTTTPIGRAMMYVTVVFAQMERETTATRVADNMRGLAKKGYWMGGQAPLGYSIKHIVIGDKKHSALELDPEGVRYVTQIFDDFLSSHGSLNAMVTRFRHQGIRTLTGKFFSKAHLHNILTMPYCVEATPEVYDYYAAKGCIMDSASPREKWDGSTGVLIYGRFSDKSQKHLVQPPENWTICLGLQKPFIPAEKWLAVQERFKQNTFCKDAKWPVPLLRGILRCNKCGSLMPVSRRKKVDGTCSSWYYCRKRKDEGSEACDMNQIKCDLIDEKVLEIFRKIALDPDSIHQFVKTESPSEIPNLSFISSRISSVESKIGKLAASLALAENSTASKYIIEEIERLDAELAALKREASHAEMKIHQAAAKERNSQATAIEIAKFINNLDGFSAKEKNEIARSVIRDCRWDGEKLFLTL